MNLIRGVTRAGGVEAHGTLLPAGSLPAGEGSAVVYGIRPEHLDLADDGLAAEVRVVEPTGAETLAYLQCGGQEVVAVFRDRHDLRPGQRVHLRPRAERAHLFDPETGRRLQ